MSNIWHLAQKTNVQRSGYSINSVSIECSNVRKTGMGSQLPQRATLQQSNNMHIAGGYSTLFPLQSFEVTGFCLPFHSWHCTTVVAPHKPHECLCTI